MRVLKPKEKKGPPFDLDADTLRMVMNNFTQDYRSVQGGRYTLHATSLTLFLALITAFGLLVGAGAQYGEKLSFHTKAIMETFAITLPLLGISLHVVFLLIQHYMHRVLAYITVHGLARTSLFLGHDVHPDSLGDQELRTLVWRETMRLHEFVITILHVFAILMWIRVSYLVSKAL